MKFIIEPGTSADINELEKLYDELNDYLAGTISYPVRGEKRCVSKFGRSENI